MITSKRSKDELRQSAITARRGLSDQDREHFSATIRENLLRHLAADDNRAEELLSYRAMPSEVNVDPLFALPQFRLFAPVTHHHEHMEWRQVDHHSRWSQGLFGIMEPESGATWKGGEAITTLLCPLTAFDRNGNRLGMGKGCFDYWLAGHRSHILQVIGLAFSCQELPAIPVEPHDIPMDFVITEQEVIRCQKR